MGAREAGNMANFKVDCLEIYEELKRLRIDMELKGIGEPAGVVDTERFHTLTRPNRAATGLNYTRLFKNEAGRFGCSPWDSGLRGVPYPDPKWVSHSKVLPLLRGLLQQRFWDGGSGWPLGKSQEAVLDLCGEQGDRCQQSTLLHEGDDGHLGEDCPGQLLLEADEDRCWQVAPLRPSLHPLRRPAEHAATLLRVGQTAR